MTRNVEKLSLLYLNEIYEQLKKYGIDSYFQTLGDVLQLNDIEIENILSLNVEPKNIKFDPKILIDRNMLNKSDYLDRIKAIVSIKNAEGWYHLFDCLVKPEFLNSEKFFQDIETINKAECAQIPLWVIGDSVFINSPFHDDDFELLVTAKDNGGNCNQLVWEAISMVIRNLDSINSPYHKEDIEKIIKYGSKCLQGEYCYPKRGINCLAIDPISLSDRYHSENMDILAQNPEIGNFLYAVMTSEKVINKNNYRIIINEMVENKNDISYVFLVCYYAIGEDALVAQNLIVQSDYYHEITSSYDINELLKMVDEKLNIIDSEYKDVTVYEIEDKCVEVSSKRKNFIRNIFNKRV